MKFTSYLFKLASSFEKKYERLDQDPDSLSPDGIMVSPLFPESGLDYDFENLDLPPEVQIALDQFDLSDVEKERWYKEFRRLKRKKA